MDDIWLLDTHEISFSGPMPTVGHRTPRAGHCAVCLNILLVIVCGMSKKQTFEVYSSCSFDDALGLHSYPRNISGLAYLPQHFYHRLIFQQSTFLVVR